MYKYNKVFLTILLSYSLCPVFAQNLGKLKLIVVPSDELMNIYSKTKGYDDYYKVLKENTYLTETMQNLTSEFREGGWHMDLLANEIESFPDSLKLSRHKSMSYLKLKYDLILEIDVSSPYKNHPTGMVLKDVIGADRQIKINAVESKTDNQIYLGYINLKNNKSSNFSTFSSPIDDVSKSMELYFEYRKLILLDPNYTVDSNYSILKIENLNLKPSYLLYLNNKFLGKIEDIKYGLTLHGGRNYSVKIYNNTKVLCEDIFTTVPSQTYFLKCKF